jgi:hypothetical protein
VTPVRYKGEVNLIFLSLRLFFTLVVAVMGIRAYWRYWHYGESGPTLRKSLVYRWRKWMLMKKIKERSASHAYSSIEKIRTELA